MMKAGLETFGAHLRPDEQWSASRLARRLFWISRAVVLLAVPTACFGGFAWLCYRSDPNAAEMNDSIDRKIIREQLQRGALPGSLDLAFVGDSTCLFGIDVPALRRQFPDKSIEGFCTMAWVGPAGYGAQIKELVRLGRTPSAVVIWLSRISFNRDPSWAQWADFVRAGAPADKPSASLPAAFRYAHARWIEPMIYRPLPGGKYPLYYGGATTLLHGMRENHGSVVNPSALRFASEQDLARHFAMAHKPDRVPLPLFATSPAFDAAMSDLAADLSAIDRRRVFLVIAPDGARNGPVARRNRAALERQLAARLGLPTGNVLDLPASLPRYLFTDRAHTNRWGSRVLTRIVAKHLPTF